MSNYYAKQEYAAFGKYADQDTFQPGSLLPLASQGCRDNIGGRQFTSYIPSCKLEAQYRTILAPKMGYPAQVTPAYGQTPDNQQYRLFLQRNGASLINLNRQVAVEQAKEHCQCENVADKLFLANEFPNFSGHF